MRVIPGPRIAVSANLMPASKERRLYTGKSLQYAEEGLVDWVFREGGLPTVVPVTDARHAGDYAESLDGLLLSGGEDVSPTLYGEEPRRPEWSGTPRRDYFEVALIDAFATRQKPILGICRGIQILNVALGGTLYQDLVEEGVVSQPHRDQETYCRLRHRVRIRRPSLLFDLYGLESGWVNTVHHQGIRHLGGDLEVLAESSDGVIEAVRHRGLPWVMGVQWHPEWISPSDESEGLLAPGPLMRELLRAASATSAAQNRPAPERQAS